MIVRSTAPRHEAPGTSDLLWALPIIGLGLFGFAVIYSENEGFAALGLAWIAAALCARTFAGRTQTLFIATFSAPLLLWGLSVAYVGAKEAFSDAPVPHADGTPRNEFGFSSHHRRAIDVPGIDGWFDLDAWAGVPEELAITDSQRTQLGGDILIRSPDFERSDLDARLLRCDYRCVDLLVNTGAASVTIAPEADLWHRGPRALMPGYVPQPRSFALRNTPACQEMLAAVVATAHGAARIPPYRLGDFNAVCIRAAVPGAGARYNAVLG